MNRLKISIITILLIIAVTEVNSQTQSTASLDYIITLNKDGYATIEAQYKLTMYTEGIIYDLRIPPYANVTQNNFPCVFDSYQNCELKNKRLNKGEYTLRYVYLTQKITTQLDKTESVKYTIEKTNFPVTPVTTVNLFLPGFKSWEDFFNKYEIVYLAPNLAPGDSIFFSTTKTIWSESITWSNINPTRDFIIELSYSKNLNWLTTIFSIIIILIIYTSFTHR